MMTIEEKAKRYDEAIKKLRSLHDNYDTVSTLIDVKKELENIFPELAESEEERIKEKIIATIYLYYGEPLEEEAKEMIAWLEKKIEQKEDNPPFNDPKYLDGFDTGREVQKIFDEQKPTEWSEEDEMMIKFALTYFRKVGATEDSDIIKWLKSLKDRVQPQPKQKWKPSEEQMENLSRACNGGTYRISLLMDLYQDLKKLKD